MSSLINSILMLTGPVPDETRYRRHLAGLSPARLAAQLKGLQESDARTPRPFLRSLKRTHPAPGRLDA